jgi:hypothetical protein
MRTTVTLDADVESLLRKEMRQGGESFKQIVNNAIRAGLRAMKRRTETFQPLAFNMGKPLVDLTKASTIAAELEDEELIRRHRRGR